MGQGGEALPVIDALGCLRSLMGQGGEALPVIDALRNGHALEAELTQELITLRFLC